MTTAGYQGQHGGGRPRIRPVAMPGPGELVTPAARTSCAASATVTDNIPDGAGLLVCDLDPGHPGQHWDKTDNITWRYGRPSGAEDPR